MSARCRLRRLGALLAKEFIQMRRDRITFAMMLGVPLIQLLLFGFAINNDPKDLPAALVTASRDAYSRAIVSALELTGYYRFDHVTSAAEAEELIQRGKVAFVVTIPSDFGARVVRGDRPQILVEADATDPAAASGAIGTLGTVASPGAAARHRRRGRRRRGRGRPARGRRAPPLQPRGHLAVQHRARACSASSCR